MASTSLSTLLLLSLLILFNIPYSHSLNNGMQAQCHETERNALLEFKTAFSNGPCTGYYDSDNNDGQYLETWTVEGENGDCCNWDGVECDEHNGHVIGLYLNHSCLSGFIDSSSSIFRLVHLQKLDLSFNNFSYSRIPSAISNLSQLQSLHLYGSNFSGQIPSGILHLTNLSSLDLSSNDLTLKNPGLTDMVQSLVKLEELNLSLVEVSSSIPDSLSRLTSLRYLGLSNCKLQGQIRPSVANLISLERLDLIGNSLDGEISCLQNLTNMRFLSLADNNFSGEIFPQLLSLTGLEEVVLSHNKFSDQMPRTISHLKNVRILRLAANGFNGETHLDTFFQLNGLEQLDLSYNNFSIVRDSSIEPSSKLKFLDLASCNLERFPLLLQSQDSLISLDLSSNDIFGEVPQWLLDFSTENLAFLNLSHNRLSGSFPIPSTISSLRYYHVSNNELFGELPTTMCELGNLTVFDISNNNFSGMIPRCFTDLVGLGNLSVLNLHNNGFNGPIPQVGGKDECNLVMIDMSYNQLEGTVPRDMENCINMEFLNLGNNRIDDVFPFWLGKLPTLSVLILRSNRFHGMMKKPSSGYEFPRLQIIELSNNNFIGRLSARCFEGWSAMKVNSEKEDRIMSYASYGNGSYYYKVTMTNKGINVEYTKIPKALIGIDLSGNSFTGEIPKSIAILKGMRFLNLSNNMLTGSIPFNLNGLTNLESLDLSHNKLSGEIPQELNDLYALSTFDVSFNQLSGPIPQSVQFSTFDNSSYEGNLGLCGLPLTKKCGNIIEAPPPSLEEDHHASRAWIEIDWKIVSIGYTSGFVIGVVMAMNRTIGFKRVKRVRQIRFILD